MTEAHKPGRQAHAPRHLARVFALLGFYQWIADPTLKAQIFLRSLPMMRKARPLKISVLRLKTGRAATVSCSRHCFLERSASTLRLKLSFRLLSTAT